MRNKFFFRPGAAVVHAERCSLTAWISFSFSFNLSTF